ncbi:YadA-like family protein [Vitreoscilla massiliensis]|uniref:YadA-like family protein n=1 Tax=Vitreoscilla massiliensis TaxID=1689272 RepID=A0ABY4E0N8_9NEIS|nr:YadA-like family protein [Vitreoscilla massiliensis]UOO89364.1 YadA-like family protein [Vitreoscilla massiliensis]
MDVVETVGANGEAVYTVATKKDVNFDTVTVGNVKLDQATDTMVGLSNKDLSAADFAQAGRAATEEQVQVVQNNVLNTIGGTPVVNADGSISYADIGGTGETNVNDAIKNVNTTAKAAKTEVLEGDNIDVSETKGADGQSIYTVATKKDVNFDTVTVGNVKLDQATNTMTGLSNKDLSAADFAQAGRAATEEQVQVVQNNVLNTIGGTPVINADGSISYADIGGTGETNVNDAIKNVNTTAKAAKTEVLEGDNIDVSETKGADGQSIYTVATKKDVNFDTVTVGNVKLDQATNTMTGLSNKDLSAADFAQAGRAATEEQVQVVQNNVLNTIGGTPVINADGSISYADIGGTGETNVNDAIKKVNTASKAAKTEVVEGDNIEVAETTGADGQSIYTVATKKDVNFDTVTVGNVKLDQATDTMTGLSNKDLSAADFAQAGRAATEEQVQVVQDNVQNIIGGNTVINPDGSITNANIGDTGESNVNDAIKKVNTASKAAKTEVIEGDNIEVIESIGADGQSIYTVATARNVNFDSVMVGNVLMSGSSNTITGLSNTDLSASDFAQAGRAATEEQLQAVKDQLQGEQQAANDSAVKYDKNADGSVNKDSVTFEGTPATSNQDATTGKITTTGGTSLNNVASAGDYKDVANANKGVNAGDLNNAMLDASKNTADIIGGNTTVNPDGSISNNDIGGTGQSTIDDAIRNVNQAAQAAKTEVVQGDNIVVNKSTGADGQSIYTVSTAKDVKFDSVTADKVQVGNVSITSKGIDAGNTQITGVAAGAVNSSSTDAVNGSQLNASNQQIANALGGGAKMENNVMTAPSYTIGHGDNAQTYDNVGGALDALNKQDQALGNSITNLNQGLRDVNQRIDDVEKKANAGIAAAMAMETAPFIAGKYTYAVGAAYHGGENAVGATLRKTSDNGRWSITGGVAAGSQGAASVRVGFSGIIN